MLSDPDLTISAILQDAWERAEQRDLAATLKSPTRERPPGGPVLQAASWIDLRSEVFRRAVETVNTSIRTLGCAGYFGLTATHKGFPSDVEELRLPVLLNPGVSSTSTGDDVNTDDAARFGVRASRAWGRSSWLPYRPFAFVAATGPICAGKLVKDALNLGQKGAADGPKPRFDPPLPLEAQVDATEKILREMSLIDVFARLVVLAGHGAGIENKPFARVLHCGARGGYAGDVNARLLAGMLNSAEVRRVLADRGIEISADTLFLAALYDTTTDRITLFAAYHRSAAHVADISRARDWLAQAGSLNRSIHVPW